MLILLESLRGSGNLLSSAPTAHICVAVRKTPRLCELLMKTFFNPETFLLMKKTSYYFTLLLFVFFIAGCSKKESKIPITDETYTIEASNLSMTDVTLTIATSMDPQKSFTIPKNSNKKIYVHAAAGEYVKFNVTKAACEYRIKDARGATIALYQSFPSSAGSTAELDFIAFAPSDTKKDFIQYKTGMAKAIGESLPAHPYLLRERYFLENGTRTDNTIAQEPCSFGDEYIFTAQQAEFGNFNPERIILYSSIDASKSACSYSASPLMPADISVFTNGSNTVSFPIWDRLAVDGPPSDMIYRQLTIDSLSSNGSLTLHREMDGKKEVFVYSPK
jgi:hypothetical protein